VIGEPIPLPVSVARTAPLEARTTVADALPEFGTQRFVPSNASPRGKVPTVTVCRMLPAGPSFRRVLANSSAIQMFAPS
jgi:hypothetical protein